MYIKQELLNSLQSVYGGKKCVVTLKTEQAEWHHLDENNKHTTLVNLVPLSSAINKEYSQSGGYLEAFGIEFIAAGHYRSGLRSQAYGCHRILAFWCQKIGNLDGQVQHAARAVQNSYLLPDLMFMQDTLRRNVLTPWGACGASVGLVRTTTVMSLLHSLQSSARSLNDDVLSKRLLDLLQRVSQTFHEASEPEKKALRAREHQARSELLLRASDYVGAREEIAAAKEVVNLGSKEMGRPTWQLVEFDAHLTQGNLDQAASVGKKTLNKLRATWPATGQLFEDGPNSLAWVYLSIADLLHANPSFEKQFDMEWETALVEGMKIIEARQSRVNYAGRRLHVVTNILSGQQSVDDSLIRRVRSNTVISGAPRESIRLILAAEVLVREWLAEKNATVSRRTID